MMPPPTHVHGIPPTGFPRTQNGGFRTPDVKVDTTLAGMTGGVRVSGRGMVVGLGGLILQKATTTAAAA